MMEMTEKEKKRNEDLYLFEEQFKNSKRYKTKKEGEPIWANEDVTICLSRIPSELPSSKECPELASKSSISEEIFKEIKPFLPRIIRLVKYDNRPFNFELESGMWLIVAPNLGEVLPEEKKV